MYPIRRINSDEVEEALALALEVFLQFEAPDYKPEGIATFKRDIIEKREFIAKCQRGVCPIYAAFDHWYALKPNAYKPGVHQEGISSSRCRYFNISLPFGRCYER